MCDLNPSHHGHSTRRSRPCGTKGTWIAPGGSPFARLVSWHSVPLCHSTGELLSLPASLRRVCSTRQLLLRLASSRETAWRRRMEEREGGMEEGARVGAAACASHAAPRAIRPRRELRASPFRRSLVVHLLRWRLLRWRLLQNPRRGLRRRLRHRRYRWWRQRLWQRPQLSRLRPSLEKSADAEAERGLEFLEPCCAFLGAPRNRDAALVLFGALGFGLLLLLWVAERPHHALQLHRVDVA